ncbi:hypothetical protein [Streptomyces cinnamoneus]|uniref:Uncharacterized protein n=1 Tax=Streptomyces cinnamoneus TaxID=53446 RepID=A0A918TVF1_STRCJ|nr:hypothetical protein [Streptomyces cinnamoneus]GHC61890.1 hypothetical protein GCM10010507_43750 [Streptomyces cinnamoneus]
MSAHEPAAAAASANRSEPEERRPLSMRDLLAACAAADAVSTPPKAPGTVTPGPDEPQERGPGRGETPDPERDAA